MRPNNIAIGTANDHHHGMDPIRRFTLLVLLQAQQDRATELVIAPTISERTPIRYKVEGTWYDMSPLPSHILPDVVAELGRLAKLPEGVFPERGIIDEAFSGVLLRWKMERASAEAECVHHTHSGVICQRHSPERQKQ